MNVAFAQVSGWVVRYLLTIRISDILDIAIMAFVLYKIFTLVQSTKAASLVKGLLIFLAALVLSSALHLNGINYIMTRMVNLGLLALIILFQPEIRRVLEQVGSRRLVAFFIHEESASTMEQAIGQTVLACTEMSQSRTGALIVFEREILLDDMVRSGTVLDAAVSAELLKNIFFVKAPMHDGAVIVRHGRVLGAGCMLPLSKNVNLSRDLGMRHRAGIGMSENSDAVVVIVSEETGEPIVESTSAKMGTVEALKATFSSGRKFWPLAIWFFMIYGTIMLWQASQAGAFYQNGFGFSSGDAGLMVTMVGVGMVFGCPIAGRLSDKILKSRKKVIIIGTLIYTIVWAVIWLTAGNDAVNSFAIQAAINFLFGFFGGFFVVSYAQIKELFPIAMAGTSTAALNLFPFAGGAILTTVAGFIVVNKELAEFQTLWMIAFILMVIGCICAFLSMEKADVEKAEAKKAAKEE